MTDTSRASSLSASGIDSGLLTLAMSTLTPCCNMGVITMKMISNTSITSTIGVTLMLELTLTPSFRLLNAIKLSPGHSLASARAEDDAHRPGLSNLTPLNLAPGLARRQISHSEVCIRDQCLAAAHSPPLQEVIDQFARRVVHLHV